VNGPQFLFQLLRIVAGFILAVIACGLFLAWGFFRGTHPEVDPVAFGAMFGTGLVGASVVGAASLVPAGVLIAIAEAARLRSLVFHVAAGGALAFVVWTLGGTGTEGFRPGSAVALASGFIAGAVYWAVAGRRSGDWLGRPQSTASEDAGASRPPHRP
jgi:hypothetical protein